LVVVWLVIALSAVQVLLMEVVRSAVVAMDAHRGVAAVVELGLRFLSNLSLKETNRVRKVDNGRRAGRMGCWVCVECDWWALGVTVDCMGVERGGVYCVCGEGKDVV
jgi:hypothetical protein